MSAGAAVVARLMAALEGDPALLRVVHGVFDQPTARASVPFIEIGAVTASDWGTKDRAGSELRIMVRHVAVRRDGTVVAERIAAAVAGLRGRAEGWEIVAARVLRTRGAHDRQGRWEQDFELRVRCLVGGGSG
jgi:Protein of unknown function (DUF3168)